MKIFVSVFRNTESKQKNVDVHTEIAKQLRAKKKTFHEVYGYSRGAEDLSFALCSNSDQGHTINMRLATELAATFRQRRLLEVDKQGNAAVIDLEINEKIPCGKLVQKESESGLSNYLVIEGDVWALETH